MPPSCDSSSDLSSSRSSTPPSPTKTRLRPPSLRLHHIGVDPSDIIGKVLIKVHRSSKHPALTLEFSDNTTFQVLVDGYDPVHRGVPKELEMDPSFHSILFPPTGRLRVELPVVDCALVTLTDKAFERKPSDDTHTNPRGADAQWNQNHQAIAFKFAEENARWHCVWATLQVHDESLGVCVFRSYDDVYLERLQRSPRQSRTRRGGWATRN